ncbi:MAG: hypothetical protein HUJ76_08735 [Parasporobacterium sp.]|nr:hypothetical protein [Parasporobacterium sp.]
MYIIAAFAIFIASLILSMILDITMIAPITLGLVLFGIAAMKKGYSFRQVSEMALSSLPYAFYLYLIPLTELVRSLVLKKYSSK